MRLFLWIFATLLVYASMGTDFTPEKVLDYWKRVPLDGRRTYTPGDPALYSASEGGMRNLYYLARKVLSPEEFQDAIAIPVFRSGPHRKAGLDLASQSFGHYDPKFVEWLGRNLMSFAKQPDLTKQAKEIYEKSYRRMARVYYEAYLALRRNKAVRDDLAKKYEAAGKNGGDAWGFIRNLPTKEDPKRLRYVAIDLDPNSHQSSLGFWLRRTLDGTFDGFGKIIEGLIHTFDERIYDEGNFADSTEKLELPYYEFTFKDGIADVLLARSGKVKDTPRPDSLTVLDERGTICSARWEASRVIARSECCKKEATEFVAGRYQVEGKCKNPLLFLPVSQKAITPLMGIERRSSVPADVLGGTSLAPKVNLAVGNPNENAPTRKYSWEKGEKDLTLKIGEKGSIDPDIQLKRQCTTRRAHGMILVHCKKAEKSEWNAYGYSFVFMKKDLIAAFADYSGSGIDGYDPFHYKVQDAVALFDYKGRTAVVFRPGYLIYSHGSVWNRLYREPLEYYGECDCS